MASTARVAPEPIEYPPDLPITARRDELLATIRDHQVVVVAGETGSGKSTQLPKICLELGRGVDAWIGHTQPRRIAARAIAERVSDELGTPVGSMVGYAVRFTDRVGDQTMIKVMTDGILLAEIQRDRYLRRYDTIIIDEAHERSLNIDFLLGYLHQLLPRRPDLKLVITSATIDTELFSSHFGGAPIVEVSGRGHPVEIRYRPLDEGTRADDPVDQPTGVCEAVTELIAEGEGDILVFCSGEREIRDTVDALGELDLAHTEVVPLFARLSSAEQHRVFSAHRGRRIVVATNVAETSLTVPGVRYVVDSGTARISRYNRRTKVQRLPIEPVSRASADQRAGRCGRIGPGIAIRLYSEADLGARPEFTDPEILRTNLASVILQMAAADLGAVEDFPFVDPPDRKAIRDGVALLDELGAVHPEHEEGDDRGLRLTRPGRRLARLPVDPRLGRMLLEGAANGCLAEVMVIASGLSIQDPRERPLDQRDLADRLHGRFTDPGSDFMSMLNLWRHLDEARGDASSSQFRRMCRRELINYPRVREWQDLHAQIARIARTLKLPVNEAPATPDIVHLSLLAGLLSQVGTIDRTSEQAAGPPSEYRGARNSRFSIAPGSSLGARRPRWVMAAELVETDRLRARGVAPVRPEWIEKVGGHLLRYSYSEPWWDEQQGAALTFESASLYGLPVFDRRTVQWSRIDPVGARDIFIRRALLAGEWDRRHGFIARNREAMAEVAELETRLRRSDILVDTDRIAAWFAQRIPDEVTSAGRFDRWWARERRSRPHLLDLDITDLMRVDADTLELEQFPQIWRHGDIDVELAYTNDPSTTWDGLTVDIPAGVLDRIDSDTFEWQVPGFRGELVEALMRSLPKPIRRGLVPIPETARAVAESLDPTRGSLHEALRIELSRRVDVAIPPDAFDTGKIPNHLRPSYRVIGDDGSVVAEGTDLAALKALMRQQMRSKLASSSHDLEQVGLTSWTFGELPRVVETEGPGHVARAYPALVDEGDSVAVRLVSTPEEQCDLMWAGTRRLLILNRPSVSKALRELLRDDVELALVHGPYPGPSAWFEDMLAASVDELMLEGGAPAWDAASFDALLGDVRRRLPGTVARVGRTSAGVLIDLRSVRSALADLDPRRFEPAVADVQAQLDRLVYPGFMAGVGSQRLGDLRRYLQAIDHRLARLPSDTARDRVAMAAIRPLEARFDGLAADLAPSVELEQVGWMLQELRVSLFAQSVGVKGTVSEKRARRALDALADPR